MTRPVRRGAAALAIALALPALAYVLPAPGILRRMGERRAALALDALSVSGTVTVDGDDAAAVPALSGLPRPGGFATAPAEFRMKVPERCRLELALPGVAEGERPFVAVREGRVASAGGLGQVPSAVALVRATCALLATRVAGDATQAYATALAQRGVAVAEVSLGRFDGRVAYVLGGRAREPRPLAFVEKEGFQPLRLISPEGGVLLDVRLLGWGSPSGGDWFPRAVEVWSGDRVRLRFTAEQTTQNPRLPDLLFP